MHFVMKLVTYLIIIKLFKLFKYSYTYGYFFILHYDRTYKILLFRYNSRKNM